jgi:hypothetical protein
MNIYTPTIEECDLIADAFNSIKFGGIENFIYGFCTCDSHERITKINWLNFCKEKGKMPYDGECLRGIAEKLKMHCLEQLKKEEVNEEETE